MSTAGPPAFALRGVSLIDRLQSVDLHFPQQSRTILVGKNGSGKSTLLKVMAGLVSPHQGQVKLQGESLERLSISKRASLVAWLPQRAQLDSQTEVIELLEAARFRFHRSGKAPTHERRFYLEAMEIAQAYGRRVGQLSGGELQRVLLACLLAQEAPILLVDEPGNHLDPAAQLRTYQLLGEISSSEQKTLVVASHQLQLGDALHTQGMTRVVGLDAGRVAFEKSWQDNDLASELKRLYQVPFFSHHHDAAYAVDFKTTLSESLRSKANTATPKSKE